MNIQNFAINTAAIYHPNVTTGDTITMQLTHVTGGHLITFEPVVLSYAPTFFTIEIECVIDISQQDLMDGKIWLIDGDGYYIYVIKKNNLTIESGQLFIQAPQQTTIENDPNNSVIITQFGAGSSGSSGNSGTNGISGTSGLTGSSGSSGLTGTSGVNGTSGINGTSGQTGATGSSGSSGVSGSSGTSTPGIAGSSGSSGQTGAAGSSGSSGANGLPGASGSSGSSGQTGAAGSSGSSGQTGAAGSSGTSGQDGDGTAYYGQVSKIDSGTINIASTGVYQSTGLVGTLDSENNGVILGTDTFSVKNNTGLTQLFKIYGSADIDAGNNKVLGIKLALNGTPIDNTECNAATGTNTSFAKLVTNWMIELAPNDEVALYVTNKSNTGNVTFLRGRLVASTVGKQGVSGTSGQSGAVGSSGSSGSSGSNGIKGLSNWTAIYSNNIKEFDAGTFIKTSGVDDFDAGIRSLEGFPTVYVAGRPALPISTSRCYLGLNTDPGATNGWDDVDYLIGWSIGQIFIHENGLTAMEVSDVLGIYPTDTTEYRVTYDGINVRYYVDNTLVRTVARSLSAGLLYADATIYNGGGLYGWKNLVFGPYGQIGGSGTSGVSGSSGTSAGGGNVSAYSVFATGLAANTSLDGPYTFFSNITITYPVWGEVGQKLTSINYNVKTNAFTNGAFEMALYNIQPANTSMAPSYLYGEYVAYQRLTPVISGPNNTLGIKEIDVSSLNFTFPYTGVYFIAVRIPGSWTGSFQAASSLLLSSATNALYITKGASFVSQSQVMYKQGRYTTLSALPATMSSTPDDNSSSVPFILLKTIP